MFFFSFYVPSYVAYFIITFDIYWILRTIFIAYYSVDGYRKLQAGKKIDWWERCQNISTPVEYGQTIKERISQMVLSLKERNGMTWKNRQVLKKEIARQKTYLKEVEKIAKIKDQIMDWREVIHVVMLPTASEPAEVIEPSVQAIKDANFPNEKIIILLATEEREDPERRLAKVKYLKEKLRQCRPQRILCRADL